MTTAIERTYDVPAPIEDVWALISDPAIRAEAISVVKRFYEDGEETVWELAMPIRGVPGTIRVRTRDVERTPPTFVRFVGTSKLMDVEGEHELSATDRGCHVRNRFVVDGRFPGIETYFSRHIDSEIENLAALIGERLRAPEE